MKDELRELYPQLSEEELDEAEYNIQAYAEVLAEMYLRIQREKELGQREALRLADDFDP